VATWAAYSVAVAPLMTRHTPYRISAYVLTIAALLLLIPGASQVAAQDYGAIGWEVWATFAFALLGALVLTNVLWFRAIDLVGPSRASLFANLQFFLAVVFGVILLGESITPLQVAGGCAIGAGILLSRFRRGPAPQPVE
jgi:drug/metabolite transporter (DMT)-like permease